jgi:hypothetical protein
VRALHLIDLENLLGTARDPEAVAAVWRAYERQVVIGCRDHLVVATGPSLAPAAWFGLPRRARRLVGRGVDGADKALLESIDPEHLARRYQRLVLASGDGIFAALARRLATLDVPVWQVTGMGRTSLALSYACPRHVALFEGDRQALTRRSDVA